MGTPFLHKLDQKLLTFRGFSNFFQNCWIPVQAFNINRISQNISLDTINWGKIWAKLGPMS